MQCSGSTIDKEPTINLPNFDSNVDLNSLSILIPKCKDGDESARARLLQEMQGFLSNVANRHLESNLKQKLGASDIVQLSLLRVIEHFESFRGETSIELHGWLKQIVVNEIHKARRSYRTEKRDIGREKKLDALRSNDGRQPTSKQDSPSSQMLSDERIEKFYDVLALLSPDHQEVIRLRNIERLNFKEIGERMDRSEDAVSKLWFRAILKFEERLKGDSIFDS